MASKRREETKTMGTARYRNQLEQKSLGRKLDSLSTHFRCTSRKLMTVMGQLEEQLSLMAPVGSKVIVCPKGLTEAEKAQYRRLRRGSHTPSMSLGEFDVKITDFRHDIMEYRRGNHSTANNEDVLLVEAGIVDLGEHEFCAPLTKHKHTMKEALKRASTRATEVTSYTSWHAASFKPRRSSEGSAGRADTFSSFTTTTTTTTTTVKTPRRGTTSFHRSMSHPGIGSSVATVKVTGTTSANGGRGGKSFPCRSRSALVGQRERGPKEIVVYPDYVAARRKSVGAASDSWN